MPRGQKPNPTRVRPDGRVEVVMDWTDPALDARLAGLSDRSGGPESCWPWTASLDKKGYGRFYTSADKVLTAQKAAWSVANGRDVPDGLVIDHLCRNRACVNPAHLEAVTNKENIERGLYGVLRTHCKNGHEQNEENVGHTVRQDGAPRKYCKPCKREANSAHYYKKALLLTKPKVNDEDPQ